MSVIWVSMVDKFMSGWGEAADTTEIYLVACDTEEQAEQIETAGMSREEMRKVKIHRGEKPYFHPNIYHVTEKSYNELGGMWHES